MPGRAAIAFDIDGVFKYGREWSADGLLALQKVSAVGIPYVFVTNGGGGLTEATYGHHLKEKVVAAGVASGVIGDVAIPSADRMVLSYTPWNNSLAPDFAEKRILLVGDPREKVLEVAKAYGLKRVTHYSDYAHENPNINPFRAAQRAGTSHTAVANVALPTGTSSPPAARMQLAKTGENETDGGAFSAVLVMCDPYEWYEALQISIDVLCSPTPMTLEYDAHAPHMPIHFSNPDFLSKFEHPFPRFAQGAFKVALKALYVARLRALRVSEETIDEKVGASFRQWGKPTEATFRFVEDRLRSLAPALGACEGRTGDGPIIERFYMVGDNPSSDMEGARRANIHHRGTNTSWQGVLVRTGVYKDGDETNGAAAVVNGIGNAVDWILKEEGLGGGEVGALPKGEKRKH